VLVLAGAVLFAAAAVALANVTVYSNDFGTHARASEIRTATGKHCDRQWRQQAKSFGITVRRGHTVCQFRPPVESDSSQPNVAERITMRVLKDTPKALRDDAFESLSVRSGGGTSYDFRVFPKSGAFKLQRDPHGGPFPVKGTSNAINGIGQGNRLKLSADRGRIRAFVNGKKLADVVDPNPGDIKGRKLEFGLGSRAKKSASRDTLGAADDLRVDCSTDGC
jgi:hypothetical protein